MKHRLTPAQGELESRSRVIEVLASGFGTAEHEAIAAAVDVYWKQRYQPSAYPDSVLVASQLKSLNTDADTLVAALLGSEELEASFPISRVRERFSESQASLTENVRRLNALSVSTKAGTDSDSAQQQAELLRRMLLSMVADARAVVVKLAFRTQRLHRLVKADTDEARIVANETLEIYAPLANRLGVGQLKWEMEDLSFRIVQPDAYKRVAKALEETRAERENYINDFVVSCRKVLDNGGHSRADVFGRPKHIYSIWRKMRLKRIEFNDLFDVRAVRVLVDSLTECYSVLGHVHSTWQPITREFDDYIANPKDNGYQSLHTAVIGPHGKPVEIQIRTRDMDRDAELGVAAHWQYKEGANVDERLHQKIASLRHLLEHSDDESLVEGFTQQFDADRVYVFTPAGEVVDLVAGATPLDFAYHVHSEIGHRCRGAKINGRIVSLTSKLANGDQVEVLTTRLAAPSRDWLNKSLGYLHTSRARSKVRAWFNAQDMELHLSEGRAIFDRELKRLHVVDTPIETVMRALRFDKQNDFFIAIGRNDVSPSQIANVVTTLQADPVSSLPQFTEARARRRSEAPPKRGNANDIHIRGVGNLMTQIANCCQPVPYDAIVGYITRGKGVSIHRVDCSNMLNLRSDERERLIEVGWGDEIRADYQVELQIIAFDRQGLLRDVSTVMANENVDVVGVHTHSNTQDQTAEMKIRLTIGTIERLTTLMDKLRQLRNVL